MAKQTLYDIIGVAADASADDIQRAFEERRKALSDLPESEDQRNHRSFLDHARDVLGDPGRRATYDWQLRARDIAPQAACNAACAGAGWSPGCLPWWPPCCWARLFLPSTPNPGPRRQSRRLPPVKPPQSPSSSRTSRRWRMPPKRWRARIEQRASGHGSCRRNAQGRSHAVTATAGSPLMNRILQSTYADCRQPGLRHRRRHRARPAAYQLPCHCAERAQGQDLRDQRRHRCQRRDHRSCVSGQGRRLCRPCARPCGPANCAG
jgi:curved DNA-binding protein CbpA